VLTLSKMYRLNEVATVELGGVSFYDYLRISAHNDLLDYLPMDLNHADYYAKLKLVDDDHIKVELVVLGTVLECKNKHRFIYDRHKHEVLRIMPVERPAICKCPECGEYAYEI
jgi:hypothetical protein